LVDWLLLGLHHLLWLTLVNGLLHGGLLLGICWLLLILLSGGVWIILVCGHWNVGHIFCLIIIALLSSLVYKLGLSSHITS